MKLELRPPDSLPSAEALQWNLHRLTTAEDGRQLPVPKRVVGLPGEKISIKDNRIYINGAEFQRPKELQSIKYYGYGNLDESREVDCGPGYFMPGDTSIDFHDSRYPGVVTKDRFRGRVWCIVWPRSQAGFVK